MVKTATEQGMTGEVIMGNSWPSASEQSGYINGMTRSRIANALCWPVRSSEACFTSSS